MVSVLCYNNSMIEQINILHNRRGHSASAYVQFVEGSTEYFLFGKELRYAFNQLKDHYNSTGVMKPGTGNKIYTTEAQLYPPMGSIKHWELHIQHDFKQRLPEVYDIPVIPESLLDQWNDIVAKWTNPKLVKNDSFEVVF